MIEQVGNQYLGFLGDLYNALKLGLTPVLFLIPFLIVGVYFYYLLQHKHTIVLRKKTNNKTDVVTMTKFMVVKKRGDPVFIVTLKGRIKMPMPPIESIEITDNGKMYVECYISEGGEATFIEMTAKDDLQDIMLTKINTNDKSFYWNRDKLANEKYKVDSIMTFLNQHAGVIGLIIFVAMVFVFWGDVVSPALQHRQQEMSFFSTMMTQQSQLVDRVALLVENRQRIESGPLFNVTRAE